MSRTEKTFDYIEVRLPKNLTPTFVNENIRLGNQYDGGYEVNLTSIKNADFLLSLGMNEDWSFEERFLKINRVPTHIYDHTVTNLWLLENALKNTIKTFFRKYKFRNLILSLKALFQYRIFTSADYIVHFKEKIVRDTIEINETSFTEAISRTSSSRIFLKMDIEGSEYRVLDQVERSLDRIVGMAIEFHDLDLFQHKFEEFLNLVLKKFEINSININNFAKFPENNFPRVIEICLSRSFDHDDVGDSNYGQRICTLNNPLGPKYRIIFEDK